MRFGVGAIAFGEFFKAPTIFFPPLDAQRSPILSGISSFSSKFSERYRFGTHLFRYKAHPDLSVFPPLLLGRRPQIYKQGPHCLPYGLRVGVLRVFLGFVPVVDF